MNDFFTVRFNEVLKASLISQTELAKALNISKQTISDYKSGKAFPSIQTLRKLCEQLEVSADYLLGIEK